MKANIRNAGERNASPEQLGKLWLMLANRYHDRFELEKAEDAYAHAIHLLSDTSSLNDYAESLHGMGNVYGAVGQLREARKCLTKSLDIYATLNDEANVALLHLSLGLELLAEHKYRDMSRALQERVQAKEVAVSPAMRKFRGIGRKFRIADKPSAIADVKVPLIFAHRKVIMSSPETVR